jgi:hypothetical protein
MKALPPQWSPPGWQGVRGRVPAIPLGFTLLATLLLLAVPSLLLRRFPRPQAIGLEKLMANVSLLQSFRATPDRPVPELWRQRFGEDTAAQLWRFQTRTWWQFWDGHSDGQPYLALSAQGLPHALVRAVAVPPLRVGDLVIFPPDLISRQMLGDRLKPQVRRSSGLRLRCLNQLEYQQAVYWRPNGLGALLGPVSPFLQNVQEGCLSLTVNGKGLLWQGEAASVEGMVLQTPGGGRGTPSPLLPPQASAVLLEVRGASLEQLLSGLLARELIRQPLAERYGLGPQQMTLLRGAPFRLVIRPRADKAFQASIELTIAAGPKSAQWTDVLSSLAKRLSKEGLKPRSAAGASASIWQRNDGVVVGGWQWSQRNKEITLFLGPPPPPENPPSALAAGQGMVLMAHPSQLAERGLLPPELPEVVQRSSWLWMRSDPLQGFGAASPLSRLEGGLLLGP